MVIIEYQMSKYEAFSVMLWQYLRRNKYAYVLTFIPGLALSVFLILIGWAAGWLYIGYFSALLARTVLVYYQLVRGDPIITSKFSLAFDEVGIISTVGGIRTERPWQSLSFISQTKTHIFIYLNRAETSFILIPVRAFTDNQLEEFHSLAENIGAYQPPYMQRRAQGILGQKRRLMEKVFLSYAREDVDAAQRLFDCLDEAGIDVWFDRKSLLPGQKWETIIIQVMKESRFFIALLSSNSVSKKGYVQRELKQALEILDEYPESEIFIIPVRLDDCKLVGGKLNELHRVDMFDDWDEGMARIFKTIYSQSSV